MEIKKQNTAERFRLQTDTTGGSYISEDTNGNLYTVDGSTIHVSLCAPRVSFDMTVSEGDVPDLLNAIYLLEDCNSAKDPSNYPCIRCIKMPEHTHDDAERDGISIMGSVYIGEYRMTAYPSDTITVYALLIGIGNYAIVGTMEAWLEFVDNVPHIIRDADIYQRTVDNMATNAYYAPPVLGVALGLW